MADQAAFGSESLPREHSLALPSTYLCIEVAEAVYSSSNAVGGCAIFEVC
jgi:hypothetical protein